MKNKREKRGWGTGRGTKRDRDERKGGVRAGGEGERMIGRLKKKYNRYIGRGGRG